MGNRFFFENCMAKIRRHVKQSAILQETPQHMLTATEKLLLFLPFTPE